MMHNLVRALSLMLVVPWSAPFGAVDKDPRAVEVAERMMAASGGREAFEARPLLRFDFVVVRDGATVSTYRHWWDRQTGRYRLDGTTEDGKEYRVLFNVQDQTGKVWIGSDLLEGEAAAEHVASAYGRYINDSDWLLMPWRWLDPGVGLAYEGEREVDGKLYDVVRLSFDPESRLTPGDQYWGFVSKESGRMERWEFILQKEDGSPGDGPPQAFSWMEWQDAGGGVYLSTVKEQLGGSSSMAIRFPVVRLEAEAPDAIFNPIMRPDSVDLPPAAPTGTPPAEAGVREVLVVLNKSDHTAALLSARSLEIIRTVPTGAGPHEGAVSRDGRILYVANYGTRTPGNTLTEIDIPRGEVRRVADLGENGRPHGITVGPDGSIWVTTEGSKSVLRLSAKDLKIEQVYRTDQEITHMVVLSPDGKRAFTTNIGSGTVTVIDVESGKVQSIETGAGPEGIDITPDGREVWVAHRDGDDVAILDARTLEIKDRLPTGSFPIRVQVTRDGKRVLVSCAQSNELMVIDRVTREEIKTLRLRDVPIGIQISRDGKYAFVANTQADRVAMVDLEELRVMGSFFTGREPDGMAWARW